MSTDDRPIDHRALDAALALFVRAFVVDDKRKQMHDRLLTKERREETLAALPRWLSARTEPLAGKDKSPAGLRARLGELSGIHVDARGARRVTISRALELGRGHASLFIGDNGRVALVTLVDGAPLLCSA
ncbi:MAG TPA: hypothetical protein VM513_36100 [Kofleriaceae bacterium]|jgi:hypothetical protein|nr:hypothetical protein [Kofleriaceae bacterium]